MQMELAGVSETAALRRFNDRKSSRRSLKPVAIFRPQ
jgi:hypothetical protein